MSELHVAFVSKSFLLSHWDLEYRAWRNSENEKALDGGLALWAKRSDLKETSAESAFIDVFFRETWGYVQTGQRRSETGFSLYPKFAFPGSGASGGSGEADLAISARRGMIGSEPILPTWGIVTDMNEFRLYWYDRAISSRCASPSSRAIFSMDRGCLPRPRRHGSTVSFSKGVSSGNAAYARRQVSSARSHWATAIP